MSPDLQRERGPRPESVRAVVRRVSLGLAAARAAESLLLALAAALVTCAAGVVSGLVLAEIAGLAGLCALCAGLAWWLEHPVAFARTARELDRRLLHHGALETAFELEGRATELAPMEALVQARVLARLRPDEAVRALFPPLLVPIAAPSAAALLLFFVSEARTLPPAAGPDFAALAEGLERALALPTLSSETTGLSGEAPDGGLSRAQAEEVFTALHARQALPFQPEDWRQDPAALLARVEGLDRQLAELASTAEQGSELAARIEQARPWLDALRMGLAEQAPGAAGEGSAGRTGSNGTAQGTIGRSSSAAASSSGATSPSAAAPPGPLPELGTQAGTWWPAEYDGLVERWIELSRAERSP